MDDSVIGKGADNQSAGRIGSWPRVAIVILNWNGWRDTVECLSSLREVDYPNYLVIIVDNGSTDDSLERIKMWIQLEWPDGYRKVRLISVAENLGFSAGSNLGIVEALRDKCDYVLLLNNDTVVEKSFLTKMVQRAETHRRIGIVGCKIYYAKEPRRIWYAGGALSLLRPGGRPWGQGQWDRGQCDRERKVSFVTGAVMLVKRQVFLDVGFLDERFFFGLEDYDFCRRVLRAGYRALYVPQAVVWHKVGGSRERGVADVYRGYKSSIVYMKKHLPRFIWFLWYIFYAGYVLSASLFRVSGRGGKEGKSLYREAILKAIREGFIDEKVCQTDIQNIQSWLRKRDVV